MRTSFILSAFTVAALGQVSNSESNTSYDKIPSSLRILQGMFDNITASAVGLHSYFLQIQKDLDKEDPNTKYDDLPSSLGVLQSMFDNVTASIIELSSNFMKIQKDLEEQD